MRYRLVFGTLLAVGVQAGLARGQGNAYERGVPLPPIRNAAEAPAPPAPTPAAPALQAPQVPPPAASVASAQPAPLPAAPAEPAQPAPVPAQPQAATAQDVEHYLAQIDGIRKEQAALKAGPPDDEQKKRLELLQKQVETLEKMVLLLADQLKKQGGAGVEQLQARTATLEGRSLQAARRDRELAAGLDDVREHIDAEERYGPRLPSQLGELFLGSGTNESPLSIYGALAFGYTKILGDPTTAANGAGRPSTPGGFYFGEFTPDFLLKLNDWILLEAEIGIGSDGSVSAGSFAQADFFVNDWLTIIAGRFVTPIGWYNERLNNPWINKLPVDAPGSAPLLWLQVLPPFSSLGVQAQGAFYLGCSPLKLEYNAYVTNGLNLTPATAGSPTIDELANLENMQDTFNIISNEVAFGGRVGLWWPEVGVEAGVSGFSSGNYVAGSPGDRISFVAADLNYHKGDWDFRAEYGYTYQQTDEFIGQNITRQGFYTQVAYRPLDCGIHYLENFEAVYRYSYVNFKGIDPTTLDLTTYSTPVDVPVKRQQNEVGLNYYFAPRLVLKCAYQVNDEYGFHLHDNQVLAELAWGW
jgi:hypothetical protein